MTKSREIFYESNFSREKCVLSKKDKKKNRKNRFSSQSSRVVGLELGTELEAGVLLGNRS
jgi:hypothetical protein